MPRAVSPQGKAVGKPAAKPPPKTITPLGKAAVAQPPPKAVTAKAPPSKADRAREDWEAAKEKVAERQQQENLAAPKSPPLFAVDWSRFTSREAFLSKTAEVYRLDPHSAEGHNHHVSSCYYVSTDWGVSHPQSYSSIMLKNDSRQSHRWTCAVTPRAWTKGCSNLLIQRHWLQPITPQRWDCHGMFTSSNLQRSRRSSSPHGAVSNSLAAYWKGTVTCSVSSFTPSRISRTMSIHDRLGTTRRSPLLAATKPEITSLTWNSMHSC